MRKFVKKINQIKLKWTKNKKFSENVYVGTFKKKTKKITEKTIYMYTFTCVCMYVCMDWWMDGWIWWMDGFVYVGMLVHFKKMIF